MPPYMFSIQGLGAQAQHGAAEIEIKRHTSNCSFALLFIAPLHPSQLDTTQGLISLGPTQPLTATTTEMAVDSSDDDSFFSADSASRSGITAARGPWSVPAVPAASNSTASSPSASSPAASSPALSPGSSVSSGHLERLLASLNVGRARPSAAAAGSRRLVFSDGGSSDEEGEADSQPAAFQPRGNAAAAAAAPTQQQQQGLGGLQGLGSRGTAAGRGHGVAVRQGSTAEVIEVDLLSSPDGGSCSSSDEGELWSVPHPGTVQRRRQVVESSDEEESGAQGTSPPSPLPPLQELPPFFAAIGPLQSLQLNSPPKPRLQLPALKAATALPIAGGSDTAAAPKAGAAGVQAPRAAPPAAPKAVAATPQRPPAARGGSASTAKPPQSAAAFKRQRDALARELFVDFNRRVFGGRLPADLDISWNNRLATTAGLTHYRREIPSEPYAPPRYTARVELSSKVVDALPKLERTLCHELCHVAAWLLDHTAKPPHGPVFKKWADTAMRVLPHLDITTCHSYDIFYAFRWQCSNAACGQTYGRHSNSIDVSKKVCGACKARLVFLGKFQQDGTPAKQRQPSAFSAFVKENFQQARERCPPGTPHGEVMKQLSGLWAAKQGAAAAGSVGGKQGSGGGSRRGAAAPGDGGIISLVD